MNTHNPDFVTVDMRGLKAALVAHAQARRESVSVLVRRAVARELGLAESLPQLITGSENIGASRLSQVKLSIRLTTAEAMQLAAGSRAAGLSRGAYLAGLVAGIPALTTGANRTELLSALSMNCEKEISPLRSSALTRARSCLESLATSKARVRSSSVRRGGSAMSEY